MISLSFEKYKFEAHYEQISFEFINFCLSKYQITITTLERVSFYIFWRFQSHFLVHKMK